MNFIDFSDRKNRYIRKENLDKNYISMMKKRVKEDVLYYPTYHIAPPHGLLNDPNGLYQDSDGYFHIYYQWFPFGTVHGLKHWHHLRTKDFKHYTSFGAGIVPDSPFDYFGCFSGMTFQDNGVLHVYYTGIRKESNNSAGESIPATVHAVIKNAKAVKTGIVEDVNLDVTTYNFRDPFVFKRDGVFYMITGAEDRNNKGMLLLSSSTAPDKEFIPKGKIALKDSSFGFMLECPNYAEIGEKGLLIFSPQGISSNNKYNYRNVFSVAYAVGKPLNVEKPAFDYEDFYELDKGFDFYAPQLFKDNSGRTILFGWLGNSKCEYPSDTYQWSHMLTLPREVTLVGDRVAQQPLPEFTALRGTEEKAIQAKASLAKSFELVFAVNNNGSFRIVNNSGEFLEFTITENEYCLSRAKTTHLYNEQYGQERCALRECKDVHTCRVFVDKSSIEIFLDNGITVFTGRFFLDGDWHLESKNLLFTYYKMPPIVIRESCE